MSKLLKHDWQDDTVNWTEEDLQQAIIMRMRQRMDHGELFRIVGDMNAAKRNKTTGARLKAAGMQSGEPDMRIYFMGGRLEFVELKRKGGKVSEAQDVWHDIVANLGFNVWIIKGENPQDAVDKMNFLMDELLYGEGEGDE